MSLEIFLKYTGSIILIGGVAVTIVRFFILAPRQLKENQKEIKETKSKVKINTEDIIEMKASIKYFGKEMISLKETIKEEHEQDREQQRQNNELLTQVIKMKIK